MVDLYYFDKSECVTLGLPKPNSNRPKPAKAQQTRN